MNNRKAKQVKTPTLTVQRTTLGVADHVHAKALQHIEALTEALNDSNRACGSHIMQGRKLREELTDAASTINDMQARVNVLHSRVAEARATRFVKAVLAWGIGFATGAVAMNLAP